MRDVLVSETGAVRSRDNASERWDLMSGEAIFRLFRASRLDEYDDQPQQLVMGAIQKMQAFLGDVGPEPREEHLERGWWNLAVAIQKLDCPPQEYVRLKEILKIDMGEKHLPFYALKRLASTLNEGALKYGEENWHRGFQVKGLCNNALKHMIRWTNGTSDEDDLGHAMWGFMTAVHNWHVRHPDLCQLLLEDNYKITLELTMYHENLRKT